MDKPREMLLVVVILMSVAVLLSIVFSPKNLNTSFQEAGTNFNAKGQVKPVCVRRSLGFFIVTAYCAGECCCGEFADGVTASGHVIQDGDKFCAADPIIPFGIELDIEGYCERTPVLDRGGLIKGNRIDVYIPDHNDALVWGKQELEVFCWVWVTE